MISQNGIYNTKKVIHRQQLNRGYSNFNDMQTYPQSVDKVVHSFNSNNNILCLVSKTVQKWNLK